MPCGPSPSTYASVDGIPDPFGSRVKSPGPRISIARACVSHSWSVHLHLHAKSSTEHRDQHGGVAAENRAVVHG